MKPTRITRWAASAVAGAALALTPLALAGTASAAPTTTFSAQTRISNTGDSGGSSGVWAVDAYNRKLVITQTGPAVNGVYPYTATVDDNGTFQTIKNAGDPNSSGHELHVVSGKLTGHDTFSFTASALPSNRPNRGVPTSVHRAGAYETNNPIGVGGVSSLAIDDSGTSYWYSLAFPSGTTFGGTGIQTFSYTYKTGCETYTNAAASTGDITGKLCTSTHPVPPHTTPPTSHPAPPHSAYTIQAKGHVQSEQSNKYLAAVDGKLVQESLNSSNRWAMVISNTTHLTGLELLNSHGGLSGKFVTIPDSGQATIVGHFIVTTKRGSYYNSADGTFLNNARYAHASGNHQIGWPVKSDNAQYTSPGQ